MLHWANTEALSFQVNSAIRSLVQKTKTAGGPVRHQSCFHALAALADRESHGTAAALNQQVVFDRR